MPASSASATTEMSHWILRVAPASNTSPSWDSLNSRTGTPAGVVLIGASSSSSPEMTSRFNASSSESGLLLCGGSVGGDLAGLFALD